MRNLWLKLFIVFTLCCPDAWSQNKTVELKPIQKQGWHYTYDFKRVNNPDALQIPLQAMEDERINKYYNTYHALRTYPPILYIAPVLYLFYGYGSNSTSYNESVFWGLTFGAVGANAVAAIWSHNRMKLAVDRYNQLLMPHSTGQIGANSAGLSLAWTFK